MGITIHFKGQINNVSRIPELKEELIDIAEVMKWRWNAWDESFDKPFSAEIVAREEGSEIVGHLPIKGITLNLHPRCEPLSFCFDANGTLTSIVGMAVSGTGLVPPESSYNFVKTQFAPPEVHISIIKLLHFIKKKYIPNLYVSDEGGYWEHEDKEELIGKIAFLNRCMDKLEGALNTIEPEETESLSPDQLADLIEKKLQEKFGGNPKTE